MHQRRRASVFMSFVTSREQFLQRNAWHRLSEFLDLSNHSIDFGLTAIGLRHDAGNWLAMSGDDNGFASLDRVEQAEQMCLGVGRLNFAHNRLIEESGKFVAFGRLMDSAGGMIRGGF